MTIFISGGCKNGKSTLAEEMARRLAGSGNLYYVATMIPQDGEDMERIRRHVRQRAGKGFQTLEQGRRLEDCLDGACQDGTFLVDSVTALLANEMFPADGPWDLQAGNGRLRSYAVLPDGLRTPCLWAIFSFLTLGYTTAPRRNTAGACPMPPPAGGCVRFGGGGMCRLLYSAQGSDA